CASGLYCVGGGAYDVCNTSYTRNCTGTDYTCTGSSADPYCAPPSCPSSCDEDGDCVVGTRSYGTCASNCGASGASFYPLGYRWNLHPDESAIDYYQQGNGADSGPINQDNVDGAEVCDETGQSCVTNADCPTTCGIGNNEQCSCLYTYDTATPNITHSEVIDTINDAFDTWTDVTCNPSIAVNYAGTKTDRDTYDTYCGSCARDTCFYNKDTSCTVDSDCPGNDYCWWGFENNIFWTSTPSTYGLGSGTLAYTRALSETVSGINLTSDIIFNDYYYDWRLHEGGSTYGCSEPASADEWSMCYDLRTTIFHEIGHFFGLGHISTPGCNGEYPIMFTHSSPAAVSTTPLALTSHERYGICSLYPPSPPSGAVSDAGELCTSNGDCPSGHHCEWWCAQDCTTDSDCGIGYVCATNDTSGATFCKPGYSSSNFGYQPCTNGDSQENTDTCGLNGRGDETRTCDSGAWTYWSCVDPDVCLDGAQVTGDPCGLNNNGIVTQNCVLGQWEDPAFCADPDACTYDTIDTENCGLNDSGTRTRTCDGAGDPNPGQWGAWGACTGEDECSEGNTETQDCGLNNSGSQTRTCTSGSWGNWGACTGADECTNGEQETLSCGLNGQGTNTRTCTAGQWGTWGGCVDPDVCTNGNEESQGCTGGGSQRRTCSAGQWGDWGDCNVCTDGEDETAICGLNNNGTQTRTCTTGQWGDWGVCIDPDACVNGTNENQSCGTNGTQTRTCAGGQWGAWGSCNEVGDCTDGEEETSACGYNGNGSQTRTCSGITWGDWGACVDDDICFNSAEETQNCAGGTQIRTCSAGQWGAWGACMCVDGSNETLSCGFNGQGNTSRICTAGTWGDWSTCSDPDECTNGNMEQQNCGSNGTQTRTCSAGQWEDWTACDDAQCTNDTQETVACGLNGNGTKTRTCNDGVWSNYGECSDDDVCVNASNETQSCGTNESGSQTRTCSDGQWGAWGECSGEDTCNNGASETQGCGYNGAGESIRICNDGQWGSWSPCNDPDACQNGSVGQQGCGFNNAGLQTRVCANGAWGSWSDCDEETIVDPEPFDDLCAPCTEGSHCGSGICVGDPDGGGICSQYCLTGEWSDCPTGFDCYELDGGGNVCWPGESNTCIEDNVSNEEATQANDICYRANDISDLSDDEFTPCGADLFCFVFRDRPEGQEGACVPYCNNDPANACPEGMACCAFVDDMGNCIAVSSAEPHGGCFDLRREGESCVSATQSICADDTSCFYFENEVEASMCYQLCEADEDCTDEQLCAEFTDQNGEDTYAVCCNKDVLDDSPGSCKPQEDPECTFNTGIWCRNDDDCESGICLSKDGISVCSNSCNPVTHSGCPGENTDQNGDFTTDGPFQCQSTASGGRCWPMNGPIMPPACSPWVPETITPPPPAVPQSSCNCSGAALPLHVWLFNALFFVPIFVCRRRFKKSP
ncbi:MAG: hypothetical protein QGI45_15660, partial [Myxococcota bacterium]|nr:hypothetical protein [Myxococcota bacterium]